MSLFGIGIDIVQIDRMEKMIEKHGDVFAEKVFHKNELAIYQNLKHKSRFLAKRFAAKEAFAKAFGTGISEGITLPNIEISNDEFGKPFIILHKGTKEKFSSVKSSSIFLSISDEKIYAVAQVIIEA
ncbi:MAG: holo-ACP synthase [Gammaproteobacteria bacterium]|nr:MAG: holo-ACP synthase [Gammaproteobacteria bacterium]